MKKQRLIYAAIAGLLFACKKEEKFIDKFYTEKSISLTPKEYQSIAFDIPKQITDQQTFALVKNFIEKNKAYKATDDLTISIKERSTIELQAEPTSKGSASVSPFSVYKLSIKRKASTATPEVAVVSTDERFPAVLAYYTEPDKPERPHTGNELMLSASIDLVKQNILEVEKNRASLRASTLKKLAKELSLAEEEVVFDKIKNQITVSETPGTKAGRLDPASLGTVVSQYGPYLSTAWSKGMPYNRLMAQSCPNNWLWDNRYAISSAVVSTAQILAAYSPSMSASGTTMDWPYLTQNAEIYEESDYFGSYVQDPLPRRNMVAALMKNIGESAAVGYTCTGSTVNFTNIRNFLNSKGISVGTQQAVNVPNIKTSIEDFKPVFMYGQTSANAGHWWVIDGVAVTVGTASYLPGHNLYLHANMNEGSYYLGYYLVGVDKSVTFDVGFAHFSKNFQAYHINTTL